MLVPILLLLAGLIILLVGGEIFVKGAASLAKRFGVKPIVIGLTVVAFGTSMPELVVNLFSASSGATDLALGNVLGSNISNILLVLGTSAIIRPLVVKKGTTWKEIPFSILSVFVLYLLANDIFFGNNNIDILTRGDGLILISFFVIFLYYTFGISKVEVEKKKQNQVEKFTLGYSLLFMTGGMICLTLGGKLMVDNGIILARLAGLSELLIGLTITALGTSLPELATSAIAAYRGHVDIAIGNVVGSNIFNILWVLGLTPVVSPMVLENAVNFDILVTIGASLMLFLFMIMNKKKGIYTLQRWHGALFVVLYFSYTASVIFRG